MSENFIGNVVMCKYINSLKRNDTYTGVVVSAPTKNTVMVKVKRAFPKFGPDQLFMTSIDNIITVLKYR